ALDPLLHSGHQDAVTKPLPTFLRVVDRHDCPTSGRWTGCVKDLALRQSTLAGVHGGDGRLVLLLGAAGEVMHDPVRHDVLLRSIYIRHSHCTVCDGSCHEDFVMAVMDRASNLV